MESSERYCDGSVGEAAHRSPATAQLRRVVKQPLKTSREDGVLFIRQASAPLVSLFPRCGAGNARFGSLISETNGAVGEVTDRRGRVGSARGVRRRRRSRKSRRFRLFTVGRQLLFSVPVLRSFPPLIGLLFSQPFHNGLVHHNYLTSGTSVLYKGRAWSGLALSCDFVESTTKNAPFSGRWSLAARSPNVASIAIAQNGCQPQRGRWFHSSVCARCVWRRRRLARPWCAQWWKQSATPQQQTNGHQCWCHSTPFLAQNKVAKFRRTIDSAGLPPWPLVFSIET
jgi:hypothetical protein